jgi:hypothetical protein
MTIIRRDRRNGNIMRSVRDRSQFCMCHYIKLDIRITIFQKAWGASKSSQM